MSAIEVIKSLSAGGIFVGWTLSDDHSNLECSLNSYVLVKNSFFYLKIFPKDHPSQYMLLAGRW